ncbi:MAG: CooT family nickel-binding protein [Thaumarchaeota archaeon]|nr:CooT family nickel-binding protein [Nitrososphaerota archaeon]
MCISKLYVKEDDSEKLLLDEVLYLKVVDGRYVAVDLDEREHVLEGYKLFLIDFMKHRIIMERG